MRYVSSKNIKDPVQCFSMQVTVMNYINGNTFSNLDIIISGRKSLHVLNFWKRKKSISGKGIHLNPSLLIYSSLEMFFGGGRGAQNIMYYGASSGFNITSMRSSHKYSKERGLHIFVCHQW